MYVAETCTCTCKYDRGFVYKFSTSFESLSVYIKVFWLHLTFRLILSKTVYMHTYLTKSCNMAQLTAEQGRRGGAVLELFPLTEQVRSGTSVR